MPIKVVIKRTRLDAAVNFYNRDNNGYIITPITIDTGSGTLSLGESGTALRETPDDLTLIATRVWVNLDTYKSSVGNADEIRSENSAFTDHRLAEGTYNEDNNITVIRYIYDADDTLISRQKRINKIEWEDYSE
tara:strand:- start:11 stop:412 length:402 start_codon:yes stop_codon:yes gene_type:complete